MYEAFDAAGHRVYVTTIEDSFGDDTQEGGLYCDIAEHTENGALQIFGLCKAAAGTTAGAAAGAATETSSGVRNIGTCHYSLTPSC